MASAKPETQVCHDDSIAPGMLVRLRPALCPTEDDFYEFCRINADLRIERNADGGITIMEPAGWGTGTKNARITSQLTVWAIADGTGEAGDSSTGYRLPNGAVREPDASWVSNERLAATTPEERLKFLPLCPDFAIELSSPTDRLGNLKAKMAEYVANGAKLGWLIDPIQRQVFVYRPGSEVETLDAPDEVSGEPLLKGFRLRTEQLW